jgi:endonuclease/exonuclease/phosphatase family metal-dependent hydrolase
MTVLAVWTVKNTGDQRPSYAGQLEAVIERWRDTIEHQPAIIAGDLNASFQGPSLEPHRRNIDTLEAMGTRSAFQLANGPVGPDDEPATLRWIGPGKKPYLYHCDYIFVSALLAGSVMTAQVGSLTDWVETKLSDHCPVLVELDDAQLVAPANDLIQERKRRESQHHETTHAPKSP